MRALREQNIYKQQSLMRISVEMGLLVCTILLAIVGFVRILPALIRVPDQIDFGAYYVAARVLNEQGPLYQADAMAAAAKAAGDVHHTQYIYPPFWAALVRPLALLPYPAAEFAWLVLNFVCFVLSVVILIRVFELPNRVIAPLVCVLLLVPAVYDTMLLGQVNLLLTLLLTGAFAFSIRLKDRRDEIIAGVLLGIAVAIKVYPVVIILIFFIHKRITTIVSTGITVLAAMLIGILFGGGWINTAWWIREILPSVSTMTPFPSNQSLRGVIERFFSVYQFEVPVLTKDNYTTITLNPIINSPVLGIVITYIGIVLLAVQTVIRMRARVKHHDDDAAFSVNFALMITLMLLITPVVWDNYFAHLLIPLFILGWYGRELPGQRLLLLIVFLLIVLQRYWRWITQFIHSPWFMLFGFLGVLILWLSLIKMPTRLVMSPATVE